MYQDIYIKNFRSVKSLHLKDLKQINLISGKNNTGKTSILEAMFLLTGISNPQLAVNIHLFRNLRLTHNENFNFMFHNQDFENEIEINGTQFEGENRTLYISPMYDQLMRTDGSNPKKTDTSENIIDSTSPLSISPTTGSSNVKGVQMRFKVGSDKDFRTGINISESGLNNLQMAHGYQETLNGTFISPQNCMNQDDERVEKLLINKELNSVIRVLREIDPALQDIRMGTRGMIYVDLGLETMVPLNIMGDGIRKVVTLLASIASLKNGVIFIDEMENGLHYSALRTLWKAILTACREYNVQLIATTHSYECISSLVEVDEEFLAIDDTIRLFRLDRSEQGLRAFSYDREMLRAGIDREIEVR